MILSEAPRICNEMRPAVLNSGFTRDRHAFRAVSVLRRRPKAAGVPQAHLVRNWITKKLCGEEKEEAKI